MDERGPQTVATTHGELEVVQLLSVLVWSGFRELVRVVSTSVGEVSPPDFRFPYAGHWDRVSSGLDLHGGKQRSPYG